MRSSSLAVLLACVCVCAGAAVAVALATPAPAGAAWTPPLAAGASDGAVAPDGTSVVGAFTDTAVLARIGAGQSGTFPGAFGPPLVAAADGGQGAIAFADAAGELYGAVAIGGRFVGAPQRLGRGVPIDVAMNAAGDVAVLARDTAYRSLLSIRPAGQPWLEPQVLPGPPRGAVVLTPNGAAVTDPVSLTFGAPGSLAVDAQGRVLAAWATSQSIRTAVRAPDGTWSAPVDAPVPALPGRPRAGTSAQGDAVVVWREGGLGRLLALTGTLDTGAFGVPALLDDRSGGTGPALAVAPDGSALIAYGDDEDALRVVRRTGTAPFGPTTIAACAELAGPPSAGLDAAGRALVVGPPFVLRDDDPSAAAAAQPVCGAGPPRALYALDRVVAGVPVAITVLGAGPPDHLVRTFDRPGRTTWTYTDAIGARHRFTTKVYARARVRGRRTAGGVRLRANAFAATGRARVRLLVRRAGRVVAARRVRLGARPRTVRLRVDGAGGRLTAVLRQAGSVEARGRVRGG